MTKRERIRLLERLVADLSYRLYRVETQHWGRPYTWQGPYWYYDSRGGTQYLGHTPTQSSSTGGFSQTTTTGPTVNTDSIKLGNGG